MTRYHGRILFFAAEASARFGLHDANLILRQIEELDERLVNIVGALHRPPHGHALIRVGDGNHAVSLYVKLLLRARAVLALDYKVRLFPDFIHVALFYKERFEDV